MRRGIIYRELVEAIKKNRKGRDSHSSENMSYLKWERRGGAGRAEGRDMSVLQDFLRQLLAASQALVFSVKLRKS